MFVFVFKIIGFLMLFFYRFKFKVQIIRKRILTSLQGSRIAFEGTNFSKTCDVGRLLEGLGSIQLYGEMVILGFTVVEVDIPYFDTDIIQF